MNERNKRGVAGQSNRATDGTQLSLPISEEAVKDIAATASETSSEQGQGQGKQINVEAKSGAGGKNSMSSTKIVAATETEGAAKTDISTGTAIGQADGSTDRGKDFESALADLERVVQQLEGEVKLEDALKLFDRGMQLSQHCEGFLKSAEQKIEILRKAANGNLSTDNFNEELLSGNQER